MIIVDLGNISKYICKSFRDCQNHNFGIKKKIHVITITSLIEDFSKDYQS